jgi:hypothetical protein
MVTAIIRTLNDVSTYKILSKLPRNKTGCVENAQGDILVNSEPVVSFGNSASGNTDYTAALCLTTQC